VWDAYIDGLSARLAAGKPVTGIKAVASFFLSRVDSLLDPQLPPACKARLPLRCPRWPMPAISSVSMAASLPR
jgi:transaldolase